MKKASTSNQKKPFFKKEKNFLTNKK